MAWILYRSRALVRPRSPRAAEIWLEARRRNALAGIHGYLHHEDGCFVQYLEGPFAALHAVMARVRRDGRHYDVEVLAHGPQSPGRFRGWDMAVSDAETKAFARSGRGRPSQAGVGAILSFLDGPVRADLARAAAAAQPD